MSDYGRERPPMARITVDNGGGGRGQSRPHISLVPRVDLSQRVSGGVHVLDIDRRRHKHARERRIWRKGRVRRLRVAHVRDE